MAKAIILSKMLEDKIILLYEVFECKNCLTFRTGRSLAFDIMRTEA